MREVGGEWGRTKPLLMALLGETQACSEWLPSNHRTSLSMWRKSHASCSPLHTQRWYKRETRKSRSTKERSPGVIRTCRREKHHFLLIAWLVDFFHILVADFGRGRGGLTCTILTKETAQHLESFHGKGYFDM